VTFFRPGVGVIYMIAGDARVGDEPYQEIGGVGANQFYVFQAPSADAVNGVAIILSGPFDTEKIDVRLRLGLADEECPLARAYFDVYRSGASENFFEIHRLG